MNTIESEGYFSISFGRKYILEETEILIRTARHFDKKRDDNDDKRTKTENHKLFLWKLI